MMDVSNTRRSALKAMIASASVAISFKASALSNEKQRKKDMSIIVIVSFETKEEKVFDFSKILENVKTDLPKVEGCLGVNVYQNSSTLNQFTLVETWESKELHQINLDKLAKNGTWDTIASHLSKEPDSDYFIQF